MAFIADGGGGPRLDPKAKAHERELFKIFDFLTFDVSSSHQDWKSSAEKLEAVAKDVKKIVSDLEEGDGTSGWTGPAADAAKESLGALAKRLDTSAQKIRAVSTGLDTVYTAAGDARDGYWQKVNAVSTYVNPDDHLKPPTKQQPPDLKIPDTAAFDAAVDAKYEARDRAAKKVLDQLGTDVTHATSQMPLEAREAAQGAGSGSGSGSSSSSSSGSSGTGDTQYSTGTAQQGTKTRLVQAGPSGPNPTGPEPTPTHPSGPPTGVHPSTPTTQPTAPVPTETTYSTQHPSTNPILRTTPSTLEPLSIDGGGEGTTSLQSASGGPGGPGTSPGTYAASGGSTSTAGMVSGAGGALAGGGAAALAARGGSTGMFAAGGGRGAASAGGAASAARPGGAAARPRRRGPGPDPAGFRTCWCSGRPRWCRWRGRPRWQGFAGEGRGSGRGLDARG
jgi:hypothetical protein